MRLVQLVRAKTQHFDETGFIENGIGVRRTHETRHTAGGSGRHFGFQRGLVLEPGFAKPCAQIHKTRRYNEALCIDDTCRVKVGWRTADSHDLPVIDKHVGECLGACGRVDDRAALNMYLH